MTQAVTVRRDGDTFQARVFWWYAACLLDPESPIKRVAFEQGPKSYDDIWIEYEPARARADQYGNPLRRVHMQCKWHGSPDSYGFAHLTDPEFINANARSLLQRAHAAQLAYAPEGRGVRFQLFTNWRLDRLDPLRKMIGSRSYAIRDEKLYGTLTDNSAAGAVRKSWREHLGIDEDQLRVLARTLAFGEATDSLDSLREKLDILFGFVGLRRIPMNQSAFPYDDLVFQWMSQGRQEFDRASFRAICASEDLLGPPTSRPRVYGVKSFEHHFDKLEERCHAVLNLLPEFDERYIRSDDDWQKRLYPALKTFLTDAAKEQPHLRLALDAHITLAFAAGSVLNIKSGRKVELEQRAPAQEIWASDDRPVDPDWPSFGSKIVELDAEKPDLAVGISLTHDVSRDVENYVRDSIPTVGRLLLLKPDQYGARVVTCGRHAFQLADEATSAIRAAKAKPNAPVHLFIAGPNGFTFFLGQRQANLGRVRLYEFDMETARTGSYTPALTLPIVT